LSYSNQLLTKPTFPKSKVLVSRPTSKSIKVPRETSHSGVELTKSSTTTTKIEMLARIILKVLIKALKCLSAVDGTRHLFGNNSIELLGNVAQFIFPCLRPDRELHQHDSTPSNINIAHLSPS
jgi:hypothetical protein